MTFALLVLSASAAVAWLAWSIKHGFSYDTYKKLSGDVKPNKEADVEYPGHMAFANKGGEYFHGCRVAKFKNTQQLNKFFEPGAKGHLKLVAEVIPQMDGSILAVYTAKLSQLDLENIEEFSRNQHAFFQDKRQKREAERAEREEERLKAEAELKRLAEVGRKYEARVAKIRGLPPSLERKQQEKELNAGLLEEALPNNVAISSAPTTDLEDSKK